MSSRAGWSTVRNAKRLRSASLERLRFRLFPAPLVLDGIGGELHRWSVQPQGPEKTQGHVDASGSNWLISPLRIRPARIRRGLAFTSSMILATYSPTKPDREQIDRAEKERD